MDLLNELKKKHKELEAVVNRLKKKRLNDRTSASWEKLRELKKLKLQIKDKIINLKKERERINVCSFVSVNGWYIWCLHYVFFSMVVNINR